MQKFYFYFNFFKWVNWFLTLYFIQSLLMLFFIKRLGRKAEFPTAMQISDLILFLCSVTLIVWFDNELMKDIKSVSNFYKAEFLPLMITNFQNSLYLKFNILFSLQICCMTLKLA